MFWIYLYIYIYTHIYTLCICRIRQANTTVLHWLFHVSVRDTRFQSLMDWNKGHRWGQRTGLMHLPLWRTKFAGQWQPAMHGLLHGPISFQLSQVFTHPGPQVSYTAPCLHWVAEKEGRKLLWIKGHASSPSFWDKSCGLCHSQSSGLYFNEGIRNSLHSVNIRGINKPKDPKTCLLGQWTGKQKW